ncbi:MAG: HDOD domain-containing protein [Spirochaetales bacterium]|nr:HDOD domain-containing protein [Spirochaetales bacterium]
MLPEVDIEKVRRSLHTSVPLVIKLYSIPHETELYLERILEAFLVELGQEKLKDRLAYCMREIALNAQKANTKRVYFNEKKLDITHKDDYETGMQNFKEETLENINYYLQQQKEHGFYVKIVFQKKGNDFSICVKNNVEITKTEQIRVFDRIARARAFNSVEDAPATLIDNSEGAGLGIIIIVLMLKKIGLSEDCFDLDCRDGETHAILTIPFSEVHLEKLDMLIAEFGKEIDALPQFPENIVHLQKLISDPETDITDIARQISVDPSLTADLLKLVNSAQFMLPKKVDNIVEAVKLVGLRTLKNLLYSYGTQKIFFRKFSDIKWLWDHSYRTAFYAYTLAKNFKRKKDILDDAYVGGILHDLGQIIFTSIHPSRLAKINNFCKAKNIPTGMFERLSSGLNHADVGARIAEKWNFPKQLIAAIRFHHEPDLAPPEFRDIVNTVYLANAIANLEEKKINFEQIEPPILKEFGFEDENHIMEILGRMQKAFEQATSIH